MPSQSYGLFASGAQAARIEAKLDAVMAQLGIVIRDESLVLQKETILMTTLDDIKAQSADLITKVTAETNAETAVAALVTGLKGQVTDLTAQLQTALANGADPTEIQAIADNLTAAANSVDANAAAAAAIANTPAATPPAA